MRTPRGQPQSAEPLGADENTDGGPPKPEEESFDGTTDAVKVEPAAPAEEVLRPYLVIVAGPALGETVALPLGESVLGRSAKSGICLRDTAISRQHARITRNADDLCFITDLDSKNGTFVNGKKITTALLARGDRVQIGERTIARFDYLGSVEGAFHASLHEAGTRDALTGVASRRQLERRLADEFQKACREKKGMAVLVLDVDHFKRVNDTYGHAAGDVVLRSVAELLGRRLRGDDLVGRYGGEEFVLLLPRTTAAGARVVAESVRAGIEGAPVACEGASIGVTVSIGLAALGYPPAFGGARELLRAADEALYRAKNGGRNRVECFE